MPTKESLLKRSCYNCFKYLNCPDEDKKWWPFAFEMSCWTPLKIDKKV